MQPTIIEVNANNCLLREEILGPVFCVYKTQADEDAISIINESLSSSVVSVFNKNVKAAEKFTNKIMCSCCYIN